MDFIPQLGAVGAVLSLLVLTLWWLRRRGMAITPQLRRSGGRRLTCLERLPLSPQHSLHLVQLGSRVLLVSSSPAGCSVVERFSSSDVEGAE